MQTFATRAALGRGGAITAEICPENHTGAENLAAARELSPAVGAGREVDGRAGLRHQLVEAQQLERREGGSASSDGWRLIQVRVNQAR